MKVMRNKLISKSLMQKTLFIGIFLLIAPLYAAIQGEYSVAVPLTVSIEGTPLRTSACIPVIEKSYDSTKYPTWVAFKKQAGYMPETALVRTIDAIQQKNKSAFVRLTHPTLGRNPTELEQQMAAYMQQLEVVQVNAVKGYWKFDNFLVFNVEVAFQGRTAHIDFAYALDEQGEYRFLPYRSSELGFRAVMSWVRFKWGGADEAASAYCSDSELANTEYRIPFEKADKYNRLAPGLMIRGGGLDGALNPPPEYKEISQQFDRLMALLRAENYKKYTDGMTSRGKKRLGNWLASANEEDRKKYADSILEQKPFFILDADPFYVVYVRTESHGVQSFYMTKDAAGFKWANASYATALDRIFKQEMVVRSASQAAPFSEWKK